MRSYYNTYYAKQNSLSAYLSSGIHKHISLQQALEICVEEDSTGSGREEAYAAIAAGIELTTFIKNDLVRQLLESKFNFIGISALEALTEKLFDAELATLKLFKIKVLENREIQLTMKFKQALLLKVDQETEHRTKKKLVELISEIDQFLQELLKNEHDSLFL